MGFGDTIFSEFKLNSQLFLVKHLDRPTSMTQWRAIFTMHAQGLFFSWLFCNTCKLLIYIYMHIMYSSYMHKYAPSMDITSMDITSMYTHSIYIYIHIYINIKKDILYLAIYNAISSQIHPQLPQFELRKTPKHLELFHVGNWFFLVSTITAHQWIMSSQLSASQECAEIGWNSHFLQRILDAQRQLVRGWPSRGMQWGL